MAKDGTRAAGPEHPAWCDLSSVGSHDPHVSPRQRVAADFPSDTVIEAYLVELTALAARERRTAARRTVARRTAARHNGGQPDSRPPAPPAPLLALEFTYPGEEPASVLLTFDQLRRLHEALGRLIALAVPA